LSPISRAILSVYGIDDAKTQGPSVLGALLRVIQRRPTRAEEQKAISGGPEMMLLQSRFHPFDKSPEG
jgi:hypothetical protein